MMGKRLEYWIKDVHLEYKFKYRMDSDGSKRW